MERTEAERIARASAPEHPTPEQRAIMEVLCRRCALEREADEILRVAAEGGEREPIPGRWTTDSDGLDIFIEDAGLPDTTTEEGGGARG